MNFVQQILDTIVNFFKSLWGTISTAGYYVVGGVILGVLIVTTVAGVIKQEFYSFGSNVAQLPSWISTYFGEEPARTGTGGEFVGDARFQVITPTLIRLEYAEDNQFEDRPTMLAISRNATPGTLYTKTETPTHFTIETTKMKLTYTKNSGKFNSNNLKITYTDGGVVTNLNQNWLPNSYSMTDISGFFGYKRDVSSEANESTGAKQLGGWYRGLDNQYNAVPLKSGLLSRDGYAFIDDTKSAIITAPNAIVKRPFHNNIWQPGDLLQALLGFDFMPFDGDYQDGYVFAYGKNYKQALVDLRALSGETPLLPRKAFGVWFSKYAQISDAEYRNKIWPDFRANKVPLDVMAIDTDAKGPVSWQGWNWEPKLIPNPKDLLTWMKTQGADVLLNIHPSISILDPKLAATNAAVGSDALSAGTASTYFFQWGQGILSDSRLFYQNMKGIPLVFDFSKTSHLNAYMKLHEGFEADGVDAFWLDWCCDDSSVGGQINKADFPSDNWMNQQYANRNAARGNRWLTLSRIGASFQDYHGDRPGPWGAHRSSIHFTGDATHSWPILKLQARFAAAEGSIGQSYVSHDVGGFQLKPFRPVFGDCKPGSGTPDCSKVDPELYLRFVQLATFQPILRLHAGASAGAQRLPWEFTNTDLVGPDGPLVVKPSADFLRLRGALVPYLYTAARETHETGMPMVRAMYFNYPNDNNAYTYTHQYMLGNDLLVAPVTTKSDPTTRISTTSVWFPAGSNWVDIFTNQVYTGGTIATVSSGFDHMPVFAKQGEVITLAPYMDYSSQKPLDNLLLDVYTGATGDVSYFYEDEGVNFNYKQNKFNKTFVNYNQSNYTLSVFASPANLFPGQVTSRSYQVKAVGVAQKPLSVTVGGVALPQITTAPNGVTVGWSYDAAKKIVHIQTGKLSTTAHQSIRFSPV